MTHKLLLACLLVAFVGATFVDFLTTLQGHYSFQRLPDGDKLLFGELVVAAENDELTEFIDRVGLTSVLRLMDHMTHSDSQQFAAYLAEHTNYTHHVPGNQDVINKRNDDHHSALQELLEGNRWFYSHLPDQEMQTYQGLIQAAQARDVTSFVESVGYGAIFGLIEHLDSAHAHDLQRYLEGALAAEAAAAAARQINKRDSHSALHELLEGNRWFYSHLPAQELQTYEGLLQAAQARDVTSFVDSVGYGAIFGLIEHLDSDHAHDLQRYLEGALASEAAAAAGGQ